MYLFRLGYQVALLQYFLKNHVLAELCGNGVRW